MTVSTLGSHTLEFWSVDIAGNAETPHTTVSFVIDPTAPTTTSDAQATYTDSATITLTAADNAGGSGVESTHYILDGGTEATGTVVTVSTRGQPHPRVLVGRRRRQRRDAPPDRELHRRPTRSPRPPSPMPRRPTATRPPSPSPPTDNTGGSGVDATHYILDGGTEATGTVVTVSTLGSHTLEFWSVDVAGNAETPHQTASFTVTDSRRTVDDVRRPVRLR